MHAGNREVEHAEAMVELEREQAIARARSAIATAPADDCVDCAEPIEPRRRAAMPLARRCLRCQQIREAATRRGKS